MRLLSSHGDRLRGSSGPPWKEVSRENDNNADKHGPDSLTSAPTCCPDPFGIYKPFFRPTAPFRSSLLFKLLPRKTLR